MYSTYQMMSNATNKQYLDKTLEELVEDYKKPNVTMSVKNKIFAAMFVKLFPMMLKIQQKYYTITNEQKVDHAIFHLHRSIYHYKKNNVKFSSFFHTHFCNQMKTLLNCENNLKNAVFQNIVKDNENILKWYNNTAQSKTYSDTERYLLFNIKNCSFLSSEEKDYCACILAGYDKMQQISDRLNISKKDGSVTNPIATTNLEELQKQHKKELRKVRKIKQNLKSKWELFKQEIFR